MNLEKIISGGQTGADRAALDFAIDNDIPHGGWVPKGRLAEDGVIPPHYRMQESPSAQYADRTERNVAEADGTLIISHGPLSGGSALTRRLAEQYGKPCLHINLNRVPEFQATLDIVCWLRRHEVRVLNVAGPRAGNDPKIYDATLNLLETVHYLLIMDDHLPELKNTLFNMDALEAPDQPETVDQAVLRLMEELPLKDKTRLAGMTAGDLDRLHPSLSMYIQHNFGMLFENTRLLSDCRKVALNASLDAEGAARAIIRALWEKLRKTHRLRRVK